MYNKNKRTIKLLEINSTPQIGKKSNVLLKIGIVAIGKIRIGRIARAEIIRENIHKIRLGKERRKVRKNL